MDEIDELLKRLREDNISYSELLCRVLDTIDESKVKEIEHPSVSK